MALYTETFLHVQRIHLGGNWILTLLLVCPCPRYRDAWPSAGLFEAKQQAMCFTLLHSSPEHLRAFRTGSRLGAKTSFSESTASDFLPNCPSMRTLGRMKSVLISVFFFASIFLAVDAQASEDPPLSTATISVPAPEPEPIEPTKTSTSASSTLTNCYIDGPCDCDEDDPE